MLKQCFAILVSTDLSSKKASHSDIILSDYVVECMEKTVPVIRLTMALRASGRKKWEHTILTASSTGA